MKKLLAILIAMTMAAAIMTGCNEEKTPDGNDGTGSQAVSEAAVDEDLAAIIKNAAQVGEGTAGQSLKYAELAHEVASFAANRGYADGAVEEIKVTFEKTCEELDETGIESFNAAFMNGIIPLLDKAIEEGKYDEIKAQFEDAGVGEDMDTILKTPGLDVSYRAIKSALIHKVLPAVLAASGEKSYGA